MGTETPRYPTLQEDRTAEVCVISAGIAGLTTAYMLLQEGRSVVLLDWGPGSHVNPKRRRRS
jgi:glycine/D-amino acid oxidase-like deaminating enzyme